MLALTHAIAAFAGPNVGSSRRAPAPQMVQSKALPFLEAPANLDGSMVGDNGFDPLGLSAAGNIKWMREAELKHGRVAMLAWAGYVAVDLGWRAPGAPACTSLEAHDITVKSGFMTLLLGLVGVFEALSYNAVAETMKGETDREPGDFYLDPFGWAAGDKASRMKLAEIVHCRLGMLAFSGVVTQSALKSLSFPYW